jgi:D-3-phosphoglycerate dehydrogenase
VRVAILDDYTDTLRTLPCFATLDSHEVTVWTDHVDDDVLAERLADVEALVLIRERTPIRRSLIKRLPALRLISQRSAYPHIDVEACSDHGVVVCSNVQGNAPSYATAELTWGLVVASRRYVPQQMASLREGRWQSGHGQDGLGRTLRGSTLGVFGYGRIGRVVAGYGRAFGMRVQIWSRPDSLAAALEDGFEVAASQEALFATSDVLTLHLRLVSATRGIVTGAPTRC